MISRAWLGVRGPPILASLAIAAVVVVFVVQVTPTAMTLGADIGTLMVGTPDEFQLARGIYGMFADRTLNTRIPEYGGTYPMTAALLMKPFLDTWGVTEARVACGLRLFSVGFGALTILAVFGLARITLRSWLGAFCAAAFVPLIPDFSLWSVIIHPDTFLWFQLSLALGAVALALERRSQKWLDFAVILAAMATMTKLVGLFLLPWIVLAQAALDFDRPRPVALFCRHGFRGVVLFCFAAWVTTPTMLVDDSFFYTLHKTRAEMSHGLQSARNPTAGWLEVLLEYRVAGWVPGLMFLVYGMSFLPWVLRTLRAPRRGLSELRQPEFAAWPVVAFGFGFLAYLMWSIRDYQGRYLIPVLPSLAVAFGACMAARWTHLDLPEPLRASFSARSRWVAWGGALLLLGGFAAQLPRRIEGQRLDLAMVRSYVRSPRIEVGQWLLQHAEAEDSIIYDYNVYVPLKFKRAAVTYGLLEEQVKKRRPRYVLIDDERRKLFLDAEAAKGSERDRAYHRERVRTLALLEQDKLDGLRRYHRFDGAGVTVYQDVGRNSRAQVDDF